MLLGFGYDPTLTQPERQSALVKAVKHEGVNKIIWYLAWIRSQVNPKDPKNKVELVNQDIGYVQKLRKPKIASG